MTTHHPTLRLRFKWRRARASVLAVVVAVGAVLIGALPAAANNDPHRVFLPAPPGDLVGYCAFPVHVDFPVNKEYGTITTAPDGSTIVVLTGALFITFTNETTGKAVTVNASGPGTDITSPDGSTLTADVRGLLALPGTNLTALGLPSNLVVMAGPVQYTQASGFGAVSSISGHFHLLLDVCAAIS
jgi:hypothetical protein